jgi:hypothetical protein
MRMGHVHSKVVFSQVMEHLPVHLFRKCVARYGGDYKSRGFSCRDQFLCMSFAQLTFRESPRDIEACLRSVPEKLYHLGFHGSIARSTLADANESRDWPVYADFALVRIFHVVTWRKRRPHEESLWSHPLRAVDGPVKTVRRRTYGHLPGNVGTQHYRHDLSVPLISTKQPFRSCANGKPEKKVAVWPRPKTKADQ